MGINWKKIISVRIIESVATLSFFIGVSLEWVIIHARYEIEAINYLKIAPFLIFVLLHRYRAKWAIILLAIYHIVIWRNFLAAFKCTCSFSVGVWGYTLLLFVLSSIAVFRLIRSTNIDNSNQAHA